MSIADQINRLNNAKAAIKQSIENKGVTVDDSALLDEYPALIDSIEVGSGEGGSDSESVWNLFTDNGTRGQYLFYNCGDLTELDVSHLDTSNMTDMRNMFYFCGGLTTLDVSNFDTSKVTNMTYMFCNCSKLTELDLSNFNTSKVTDMSSMFIYCYKLKSIDVSSFDTSNVTTLANMFSKCQSLTSLDLSHFDTSKITSIASIVSGCTGLTSLNCGTWDVSKVTSNYNLGNAFDYCTSLVDFYPPKNMGANLTVSNSTALSHDSLMRIIDNLITVTTTKTLTLGATNLAKLTEEEIAIATNKGWTVA